MKNAFFYSLGIIILFSSCFKNKDEDLTIENYNADWALQVINSEFSIADILDRSDTNNLSIQIVNDDIILSYSTEEKVDFGNEFYKLPNQSFSGEYGGIDLPDVFPGLPLGPFILDSSVTFDTPLDVDGVTIPEAALKEILIESGTLVLTITNSLPLDIIIDLVIPSISRGGKALSFLNITIPANSSFPVTTTRSIDGNTVNLKYNDLLNTLQLQTKIRGVLGTEPIVSTDKLGFALEIQDVVYEHIIGRLGKFTIPLDKGTNEISLFDELGDAQIHIQTFNMKTTTFSDLGLPIQLNVDHLEFTSESDDPTVIDCFDKPIEMAALDNIALVGTETASTNYDLGTGNCPALANILKTNPTGFEYDLSFTANPQNDLSEDFFISKNSTIKTKIDGQFYLHGYLKGFTRTDTITGLDLSGEDADSDGIIDALTIRFIIDNGLPLGVGVDLYFLDKDDNVIDEELDNLKILSALVDSEGNAYTSVNSTLDLTLGVNRIANLSPLVEKIVMKYSLETTGAQNDKNVHIRPQNKMKVIIGVRATVDINLN